MKVILYACLLILISSNNLRKTANWDFNSMYSDLIVQHNILRKKHKASPLTKLVAIQNLAKKTAEGCAKLGKLQHTKDYYDNQPVGQNLYMSTNAPSAANILQGWYFSEEPHYDYGRGESKDGGVTGHFTQLVWKKSKTIGCAYANGNYKTYKNAYYICCNYYPAGNYYGQYTSNVAKPSS